MSSYRLTGIDKANFSKDRTQFSIEFRTDQEPLTLDIAAKQLIHLITCLEGMEYAASLFDPVAGQGTGEIAQIRAVIVDHHRVMSGDANGVPAVILGLKSAKVFRWYALPPKVAEAVQQSIAAEIPKLAKQIGLH